MIEFIGRAWANRLYDDRIALMTATGDFNWPVFITSPQHDTNKQKRRCENNEHDRCVANIEYIQGQKIREHSNFSLGLRGDTPGSDRWQNAMAAGAIPVGVGANRQEIFGWLPFQSIVPWEDMAVSIPRKDFTADPVSTLNRVLGSVSDSELRKKRDLLQFHHPDYDWAAYNTRMADNFLREAATVECSARYSRK
jgi:hypothetical protein